MFRSIVLISIALIAFCSCAKKMRCDDSYFDLSLREFTPAEADTLIINKYRSQTTANIYSTDTLYFNTTDSLYHNTKYNGLSIHYIKLDNFSIESFEVILPTIKRKYHVNYILIKQEEEKRYSGNYSCRNDEVTVTVNDGISPNPLKINGIPYLLTLSK
jgi:hypothetical protein